MSNVRQLHPDQPALGHYVRIGNTSYQQLEHLLEAGRLPVDRAVFDAGLLSRQKSLRKALRTAGAELILDTDVAELSTIRYFDGSLKQAPWATKDRPLMLRDFEGAAGLELISGIARFAVEHDFDTVLSPTHLLKGPRDHGFRIDLESLEKLRSVLDAEGGGHITIDFPVILGTGALRDDNVTRVVVEALRGAPVENVWVRASGFGADATPLGIVRYIRALREFLPIKRPVIADGIAGLAGSAALAFGAASGIAHGVGIHEAFRSSEWQKPRPTGAGGQPQRVLINAIDRQITLNQLRAILASPHGRRRVVCNMPRCCPNGVQDMIRDPKAHYCFQRRLAVDTLSQVPYSRRADDFVERALRGRVDDARLLARLRIADADTLNVLTRARDRSQRLYDLLSNFHSENDFSAHALSIRDRRGRRNRAVGGAR